MVSESYCGTWLSGLFSGTGVYTFDNKSIYAGQFSND